MARQRRVPIKKGRNRIIFRDGEPDVTHTKFCGECGAVLQSVTIQVGKARADREGIKRRQIIAFACPHNDKHKDGKNYIWPLEDWILPRT